MSVVKNKIVKNSDWFLKIFDYILVVLKHYK